MSLIFVFGSNTSGRHGKGAALTARVQHGAIYGISEGLVGNSYALPTCNDWFKALPLRDINKYVEKFIDFAKERQDLGFQVTRIGCGLAGYPDENIAIMFSGAPKHNVFFDEVWKPYLGGEFEYWGTF